MALSSNHYGRRLSRLPRVDSEESSRAGESACHPIVMHEVQFDIVDVGTWDKVWAMVLRCSSLMFSSLVALTLCLRIGFCLRTGGRTVIRNA